MALNEYMAKARAKYLRVALATLAAAFGITCVLALKSLPAAARQSIVAELEQRFHSTIEVADIQISGVIPLRIVAHNITLRYHGRSDVPPLMTITRFVGTAKLGSVWRRKWRIAQVHLEGLEIHVPAREPEPSSRALPAAHPHFRLPSIEFDEITADDALLQILTRQRAGKPHSFRIHHLLLRSLMRGQPAYFHAQLTNEAPPGEIDSEGTFGPWNPDEPSLTPVAANFVFANADLGRFRGLSGTLSSTGHYSGVLERLEVEGQARVPNFALSVSGNPVFLDTHYVAVVDGTNGNTYLNSVQAHFLNTTINISGEIIDPPGPVRRRMVFAATSTEARAEDLLRLVTKATSMSMTGAVRLNAQLKLPSGRRDIVSRLSLRGRFDISALDFASPETQRRVDSLSQRGQGKPGRNEVADVLADLRGVFLVNSGRAYFPDLEFKVPGARVSLKGSYGLKTEAIDLRGKLQLSAPLSHTTTGMKSLLLRPLDHFFKDGGRGSVLPIRITGSRSNPSLGLDLTNPLHIVKARTM